MWQGQMDMASIPMVHCPSPLPGCHPSQQHLEQTHVDEEPGEEGVGVEG